MAVALTSSNKQTLRRLLKTGRWNNESEILRYGLYLVEKELVSQDLSPIPPGALSSAYAELSAEEKAEEEAMAKASLKHRPTKEDLD